MPKKYYKENRKRFIEYVFRGHQKTAHPVALFMAGTPGSGKTEVAESLAAIMTQSAPVILDADRYRELFREIGYDGTNSSSFQEAANKAVDEGFDYAVSKGYSFILDGTFAVGKAAVNIKRALRHGYEPVKIYFVYQNPVVAWDFTKKRQVLEGRKVPKEIFIDSYFKSRENIRQVKQEFGDDVMVNVIIKDYQNKDRDNIKNVRDIDYVVGELYNREELIKVIK